MKPSISIIIPVFNEEQNLSLLHQKLKTTLSKQTLSYEIVLINDGSHDSSWRIIQELAQYDPSIKGINFSRNFGHQAALMAGYEYCSGDAIISIDADLQDPPSLIHAMINAWQAGSDIVYARRLNRHDTFLKRKTAYWYYRFLDAIANVKIPRNVGDFRLIDRKVCNYLIQCRENAPYLRGMVAWAGFKHTFIDFNRDDRNAGSSGYSWSKMMKLAFDGVTSFSLFPLKLAAFIGLFVIGTGSLMFLYITVDAFFNNVYYPLFKWLVTIIYIFMGIQFLLLWILGEYIGRIFEQQKNRPLYLINETINMHHDTEKNIVHNHITTHHNSKQL